MKKFMIAMMALGCVMVFAGHAEARRAEGPQSHADRIAARAIDNYSEVFTAGVGHILVRGDGDTDLDCAVLDGHGNVMAVDADSTDVCILNFSLSVGGAVYLRIQNNGSVYNDYVVTMY